MVYITHAQTHTADRTSRYETAMLRTSVVRRMCEASGFAVCRRSSLSSVLEPGGRMLRVMERGDTIGALALTGDGAPEVPERYITSSECHAIFIPTEFAKEVLSSVRACIR